MEREQHSAESHFLEPDILTARRVGIHRTEPSILDSSTLANLAQTLGHLNNQLLLCRSGECEVS